MATNLPFKKTIIPAQAQAYITRDPNQILADRAKQLQAQVTSKAVNPLFSDSASALREGYSIQDLVAYQQAARDAEVIANAQRISEGNQAQAEAYIAAENLRRDQEALQKQLAYDAWLTQSQITPKHDQDGGVKWWHIALGAGVVGGLAWYMLKDKKRSGYQDYRQNPFLVFDEDDEDDEAEEELKEIKKRLEKKEKELAKAQEELAKAKQSETVTEGKIEQLEEKVEEKKEEVLQAAQQLSLIHI